MHRLYLALGHTLQLASKGQAERSLLLLQHKIETCPLHLQGALMWMMLLVCALLQTEG